MVTVVLVVRVYIVMAIKESGDGMRRTGEDAGIISNAK